MTVPVIVSLIGIIVGLSLLIYLVMRGVNIFVIAILCSSIVAITGGMNLYTALKFDYMGGFVAVSYTHLDVYKRQEKSFSTEK